MLYERSPKNNVIRSPWAIKKLNKRISIKEGIGKKCYEFQRNCRYAAQKKIKRAIMNTNGKIKAISANEQAMDVI